MEELNIALDEGGFTSLCKNGGLTYGSGYDRKEISISRLDMVSLMKGDIISRDVMDRKINIKIFNVSDYLVKEIIRRSPIYSQIYYE